MSCYNPIRAYQCADGEVVFVELRKYDTVRTLYLPCGGCVGCRLERSKQWASRCIHEASLQEKNCFITTTYRDDQLPSGNSLNYRDWQLFMKRLRKKYAQQEKIRFYMCGEYGEKFDRPHYHACLFGIDFEDKKYFKKTEKGHSLYTSEILEEVWGKGHCLIGQLTYETAAYTARYIMKKINGQLQKEHYEKIDKETGEITNRTPEFNKMSLKPGIGAGWLEKYKNDAYPEGEIIINGKKTRTPRYYDKKYKKTDPDNYEVMQWEREKRGIEQQWNNTETRLKIREEVTIASIRHLKREID